MNNSANANLPQSGGTVIFSYNLKECKGDSTVSWTETGDTEWFDIKYSDSGSSAGTIMVSCGANTDFTSRSIYLSPSVSGKTCNGITVSQIVCQCNDINQIIFPSLPYSGVSSGNTTVIGTWNIKDNTSCEAAPKIFSTDLDALGVTVNVVQDPNNPKQGTFTVDYFPENESYYEVKHWELKTYYKTSGDVCATYTLYQDGKEVKCDCEYARYFVTTLKTSYTTDGTSGEEIMIGSGHSECGYMECEASSDMLEGGQLRNYHDNNGNFYFYGTVKSNSALTPRSAGLFFSLYDNYGHKQQTGSCESRDVLYQDGHGTSAACKCYEKYYPEERLNVACVLGENGYYAYIYDSSEHKMKRYIYVDPSDAGKPQYALTLSQIFEDRYGRGITDCSGLYVNYDENIFASGYQIIGTEEPYEYEYEYNHLFHYSMMLYFKEGAWDGSEMELNFSFIQYTDMANSGRRGYPCEDVWTIDPVYITTACTCEMEDRRYYGCGDDNRHPICYDYISGNGAELTYYPSFLCAEDFGVEIDSDYGEGEVLENEYGEKYAKVTVYENPSTSQRDFYVYFAPIINGRWCSESIYGCSITQYANYCYNCDTRKEAIRLDDESIDPCCDDDYVYIRPFYLDGNFECEYDGKSVQLYTTIIGTTGCSASDFGYSYGVTTWSGDVNTSEDVWSIEFKANFAVYNNGSYQVIWPDCYKTSTVTIWSCTNCEEPTPSCYCSCNNAYISKSSISNEYPSGYGDLTVATINLPDDSGCEEPCTTNYTVVSTSTQEGACTVGLSGDSVVAHINDVSTSTNVSLAISIVYMGRVCTTSYVDFLIRK